VRRIEGAFQRGDAVRIVGETGEEIGRGLVAYDAGDAGRIAGRKSREIETILGFAGRAEMIHHDDMALSGE
jgi:glutamate 5-kinase